MSKISPETIENARAVHGFLPGRIDELLATETDAIELDKLLRVKSFLEIHNSNDQKKWKGLQHSFIQLARAFEEATQRIPDEKTLIQLLGERAQDNGKINFIFNSQSQNLPGYAEIYHALSQQGKRSGQPVPESLKNNQLAAETTVSENRDIPSDGNLNHSGFLKIREFLSYEITDIEKLDKTSMVLSLLYPNYKDFISFVKKYGAYDSDSQTLNLNKAIDADKLVLSKADYASWGKVLIEAPKSTLFYFYCHDLLGNLPINGQGKIMTGDLDRILFEKIGQVGRRFSDNELAQYPDLDVALDLSQERKFKRDNARKIRGKADKVTGVPDIKIEGARVGLPGYKIERPSFDDPRYLHLGRYFGTCEHLTGHWGQTLKDSWTDRTSYFLAIIDPNDTIIGGCRIRRAAEGVDPIFAEIVFDGPESYNPLITNDIWTKTVAETAKDFPLETFTLAPSQSYRDLRVDVSKLNNAELTRGHIKDTAGDYWDAQKIIDQVGEAPLPSRSGVTVIDDSGLLSEDQKRKLADLPVISQAPKSP